MYTLEIYTLPAALLLDALFGDPRWLPHPIRWMGVAVTTMEARFRRLGLPLTLAGTLFALCLIAATWMVSSALIGLAALIDPMLKSVLEIALLFYCISVQSLAAAAAGVARDLAAGDLASARRAVAMIVGRDSAQLSSTGVAQAATETVAENLVDGLISPLFFAALGGVPLALTYKMINTLDSMVGYKNETYCRFGKASARIDDAANWIPARLSVPFIAAAAQILNRSGARALSTAFKEGRRHASPNAGYPEAAFAGALGVKLNGPNLYQGVRVDKPYLGTTFDFPKKIHIDQAGDLMRLSALLFSITLWGLLLVDL